MFESNSSMGKKNTAAQIVIGMFFTFVPLFVISGSSQSDDNDKANRMDQGPKNILAEDKNEADPNQMESVEVRG